MPSWTMDRTTDSQIPADSVEDYPGYLSPWVQGPGSRVQGPGHRTSKRIKDSRIKGEEAQEDFAEQLRAASVP